MYGSIHGNLLLAVNDPFGLSPRPNLTTLLLHLYIEPQIDVRMYLVFF